MEERTLTYFASDVHLGLPLKDPADRQERFLRFLKGIPCGRTEALYLLGDIWDFWYEYRDVIPREGIRVVAELIRLIDAGVKVYFFPGNHDIWCYSFFESIGIRKCTQPMVASVGGRTFCLGHGDALGGAKLSYRLMLKIFHSRTLQRLFSTLHPWIAYRIGLGWSDSNRRSHAPYHFRGSDEPLYKFALSFQEHTHVDYFVFGHFHDSVDLALPGGARLLVLKDWMDGGNPCLVFDSAAGDFVPAR